MGRDPQNAIMQARQSKAATSTDPIVTRTRYAQPNGEAVHSNLTKTGRDILGIEPGDPLVVEVYTDHIEIVPEE